MPISTESTKLSIDFAYEWTAPSGDVFEYQMKFMHGPNGPVIQISNGSTDVLELPAEMFTETADFLVGQGVLKNKNVPVLGKKTLGGTSLSVPNIVKNRNPGAVPASRAAASQQAPKVAPFASFNDPEEAESEDQTQSSPTVPLAANPARPLPIEERPGLTGKEGVTEEEAEAMKKERLTKRAKAKVEEKRIRPDHRPE